LPLLKKKYISTCSLPLTVDDTML